MNPTDQTIDIMFRLRADSPDQRGVLKLQNNNGNTILSFFHDINQEPVRPSIPAQRRQFPQTPDFSYYLCNFSALQIDPGSPLLVTFESPLENVSFMCRSPEDVTKLTDYLSQKVGIIHSTFNPAIFKLQSADLGQYPFMATLLPSAGRRQGSATLESLQHLKRLPAGPPIEVTRTNLSRGNLFNASIDRSVLFDAFKCALDQIQTPDVQYERLKIQWAQVSRAQFQNNRELSKLMVWAQNAVIRKAARFAKYDDPKRVQKTMFNILVTYAHYNWDGAAYNRKVFALLFPFLDAYIKQHGETQEKCEEDVFEVFAEFFERNGFGELRRAQQQSFIKPLFEQIGKVIETKFSDLLQVLGQKHIFSLDFLRKDLACWFLGVFNTKDVRILWLSILAFTSVTEFYESFIIAVLLLLLQRMGDLNPLCFEEVIKRFDLIKKELDLRTLLANTAEIRKILHPETPQI
jgi:hypothetical protein